MTEQEKRTPVSAPPTTALDPAPTAPTEPAPTPAAAPANRTGWLMRQKRLAVVVGSSFLALAAGVYAVKVFFPTKSSETGGEVAQSPAQPPPLEMPPQVTRPTPLEPAPVPTIKLPPTIIHAGGIPKTPELELPPIVLPPDPMNQAPIIALPDPVNQAPIVAPPDPVIRDPKTVDPPLVIDPPPARDGFTNAKKDAAKIELPKLDLPPIADPPVAKNPVIRIGAAEPKKEAAPKLELPPIPEPPSAIDVTPKKDPPVVEPLVIDPPARKETPKIEAPAIEPKIVIDPPLVIDPPMTKKDPPLTLDPPAPKKDVPVIDPPLTLDPPTTKKDPPLTLDPPMRKTPPAVEIDLNPPTMTPKKIDSPVNSNEYDEDLHPVKKDETYRGISKQYYNSDAYALALQRYNREHPGQADYVRIPPIWVLEKKYGNEIASTSARSTSNSPPVAQDLSRNEQVYTVGDNGEMLADVARKTLGSEDAWKRIWDLNSQINPAKMIPGGTRLRLPDGLRGQ